jgi:septum site-determining protein MinC
VKTKQSSVKVLDITLTNNDEFVTFFDRNYVVFQNHLIVLHGESNAFIEKYLNDKKLNFMVNAAFKKARPIQEIQVQETRTPILEPKAKTTLKVLDKLVRSGQELNIESDLLLLNRVNSGGTININGNLIITEIVEGSIRCNGDFMMLQSSSKANIVFHEVEVDNKYLTQRLNRVELKNNEITITPVLKETNWG